MTGVSIPDDVRLIAFYLPQLHPIPENDRWWGRGFTEWTNVTRARPVFRGHYQPHLPSELGFYDLRVPEVREEQARLAREHGIHGFCYYHYWFGGKRLLERPFEEVLASGRPDFPFCLCWANEPWTRRWDGGEHDVLMAQVHSEEDDERFVQSLFPAFRDARYIRVQGRPLLIVYRASLLPDPARTVATWARQCRAAGLPPPFVLAALTFDVGDPRPFGYDGAVEFPPHQAREPSRIEGFRLLDPQYEGRVYHYVDAARWFLDRPEPPYPLFSSVMTGWDNTPRRQRHSLVYVGSTPERYGEWLGEAIQRTRQRHPPDRRLVFVNAWNEWGEGAHLEPDQRHGRAYLEATREALARAARSDHLSRPPASPRALFLDATMAERQGAVFEQSVEESEFERALIGERDAARAERDRVVAERDAAVADRDRARAEHDRLVAERDAAVAERDRARAQGEVAGAELERLRALASDQADRIAALQGSVGWRVLERYRQLARSSAALSFLHRRLAGPMRRWLAPRTEDANGATLGKMSPQVVVFRSTHFDRVRRSLEHARTRFPGHEIALVLAESERGLPGGWPGVDRFYCYRASEGRANGALGLLRGLRSERARTVVLPTAPGLRSPHFSLLVLLAFLIRAERRVTMDPDGGMSPLRLRDLGSSMADVTLFCLGLPLAWLATVWAQFWARQLPAPAIRRPRHAADAVAFLVPILPDISHTFIYRELLSLLVQFGRARKIVIVALEVGSHHPLHAEAKELLAHAVFVPSCSLVKYLGLYLYYTVLRPRRMARLLDCYQPPAGPDRWMFLRVRNFHALHPSRGLALTRLLEKEGVGYIHCYGASYPATRALVAATLLGVPFSLSTYVDFDYEYAFKCLAEKLEAAEFVVACTEFCRSRLVRVGGTRLQPKIHVIHHGISATGIYGEIDGRPPGRGQPVSVFTACRLVEKKGLEYLIQAWSILRERGVSAHCVIIGEGPERPRLEALVADLGLRESVQFLGALANDEIWRRVGSHDICVVPSVYAADGERDGIPVILLEALAAGHPVVSTRVSGIPELITDGVHGLLVPERDPHALAAAIERLMGDSAQREALAAAGRARVRKEFDVHDKARQLWRLIDRGGEETGEAPEARPAPIAVEGRHLLRSVSVIMVNHNGGKFLPPAFASIASQSLAPSEVWFFDNGSTDESAAMAAALLPGIKVVRYESNTGYSAPVNVGIRRSTADYVLVLNVDVVLEDRFIEEMVTAVERYGTAGWAAGRMLKLTEAGKSDRVDCLGHHMSRNRYATETDHSRPFDWRDYEHEQFVFGASACAALYRRSLLDDLRLDGEYLDEAFFAYFEDVDLDWRAQLRGWKCVYVPSAVGYHVRGGSGLIRQPEIAACYLSNRWLMVVKNDRVRDLAADLVPVIRRLARDVRVYGSTQPRAVLLAVQRMFRLLPGTLAKRRHIQRRRVVPRAYIRSLIR